MASALEFILKLRDMLTPGMQSAAAKSASAATSLKSQFTGIEYSGKKMGNSLAELHEALKQMNAVRFGTKIQKEFDDATKGAKVLEKQIEKIQGKQKEMGGGGGGFMKTAFAMAGGNMLSSAVMNTGEWVKGGVEKAEMKHQATAQINASLKSTGGAAGMGFDDVENVAKGISKASQYSTTEMLKMQSVLLTFPEVSKKSFGSASQAIADLSAKMGQDLQSSAVQVGKALQDPEKGVTALRRIGVNFNEEQTEVIKKLVANGHKAQAQTLILTELNKEFGGSAKAAFDADPLIKFKKTMGGIQVGIGEVVLALVGKLASAFNAVVQGIMGVVHWFGEHKKIMLVVGIVIGSIVTGLIVYNSYLGIVSTATKIWAWYQKMLNTSLLMNPVVWVVIGIVALIAVIAALCIGIKGWGTLWDNVIKFMKGMFFTFVDTIKLAWLGFADNFMSGLELIEKGWYKLKGLWDEEGAKAGLASINDQQNTRAAEIAKQKGVLTNEIAETLKAGKDAITFKGLSIDHEAIAKTKEKFKHALGLGEHKGFSAIAGAGNGEGAKALAGADEDGAKSKAEKINSGGQKSIVINIGKQIEKLEMHVMNAADTADQLEAAIREGLRRAMYSLNGVTA